MKSSKAAADYRRAGLAQRLLAITCHHCAHIELHGARPATCELVEGTVDRAGVCGLYERAR